MDMRKLLLWTLLAVVLVVSLGVGMYYAGFNAANHHRTPSPSLNVSKVLQDEISAANIDRFLKKLTSVPHLAGTPQDLEQAEWMRRKFLEFGLDQADVVPYQVLLSYPNMSEPNKVYLLNENGTIQYNTSGFQKPLHSPEESSPLVPPNFNAYSATGIAQGGLVYVYYGRESDYEYLGQQGIDVSGNIVLARYGKAFRGNIAALAERKGAIGVILFSDPQDFAQEGRNRNYPGSWWMPGMAAQLGTVMLGNGDPLTPFYPSIESSYRIPEAEAQLPKIPVQPIGYNEAEVLLRNLKETKRAPDDWQGKLNVTYYLGPDFKQPGWKLKLDVKTYNKMATTYNTIGILYGEKEPDRYVLVGNHRDAWILGAVDPSSGTATMMEMARAFGQMKLKKGWRPRRTLIFCSWGAEEYGLIGSYEWVEQHAKALGSKAVAYLNVDIAVEGNYSLRGNAAPLLRRVLVESSKKIPNPNPTEVAKGRSTLFDTWAESYPDKSQPGQPEVQILGSGSDYAAFLHVIGVPCLDISYSYKENIGSYPLYHTLYETHHLVSNILDRDFLYHRAVTQLWAEIALNLTESAVLPLDVNWYASYLNDTLTGIKMRYKDRLASQGASLKFFEEAVQRFGKAAGNFTDSLTLLDKENTLALRRVNDQLMQLERHFIDPRGLPNQPQFNHIVFAPSSSNTYDSTSFAGLTDLLESVGNRTEQERPKEWAQIKQHLSVIAFLIDAAGRSLSRYFEN